MWSCMVSRKAVDHVDLTATVNLQPISSHMCRLLESLSLKMACRPSRKSTAAASFQAHKTSRSQESAA